MLLEAKKKHKVDLQKQQDTFYAAIRDVNMQSHAETARALAAEHTRVLAQQRHKKEPETESAKVDKESAKVNRERRVHTAVMARIRDQQSLKDKRWQKKVDKLKSNALKNLTKEMRLQTTEWEEAMAEKEEEARQKLDGRPHQALGEVRLLHYHITLSAGCC